MASGRRSMFFSRKRRLECCEPVLRICYDLTRPGASCNASATRPLYVPARRSAMNPVSRRVFLKTGFASGLSLALPAAAQAPAVVASDRSRPRAPSGLQIGDVLADRAVIWSRSDRPARLWVEHSPSSDFGSPVRVRGPLALDTSDYTARVDLTGLPADREVFVRVQ